MSFAPIIAATAAANRRKMLNAEEERMTTYTSEDLAGDWEFKIVRAETPVFRKLEALEKLLEEEAAAGWTMVEKLDNARVRFKRPRKARAQDAYLPNGIDPYRSDYGAPTLTYATIAGVLILLVVVGLLLLTLFLVR